MRLPHEKLLRYWSQRAAAPRAVQAFAFFVAVLPCSYQPMISLGMASSAHLEISATIIAGLIFIGASLPRLWQHRWAVMTNRWLQLLGLLVAVAIISLLYTSDATRGAVLTGFMLYLWLLCAAIVIQIDAVIRFRQLLMTIAALSVVLSCLWAWCQILATSFGVPAWMVALPSWYDPGVFGFSRPTALFAEPQFLANFLLIPVIWLSAAYLREGRLARWQSVILWLGSATLFATISRGGYLSLAVALVIMGAVHMSTWRRGVRLVAYHLLVFAVTISLLGVAAQIYPRDTISGMSAVRAIVDQLSLGTIHQPLLAPTTSGPATTSPAPVAPPAGYQINSTISRTSMASDAIALWSHDGSTILRGVGVGGFGESLARANPGYARGNVVNNQFIEILTELGVIGLGMFIASLAYPVYAAYRRRCWVGSIMIVALVIQWNFFSGNPNALHIWTVLGLTYAYATYHSRTALG